METTPKFLQGIYSFEGAGLDEPVLLDRDLVYWVPRDKRAQLIYFRAGNSCPELICLALLRDGALMRLFPIGAKSDSHVSLAVVEDHPPKPRSRCWSPLLPAPREQWCSILGWWK